MTAGSPIRVLATLALDDRDTAVLDAVAVLAERRPCLVTILHVRARPDAAVTARVEAYAARFGPSASARVAVGAVDEAVAVMLEELHADLLVVGRSEAVEGAAAWGPHGRALLRAAGCPVLVVPEGAPVAFRRAAIGMDLSASALDTLALAGSLYDEVVAVAALERDEVDGHAEMVASIQARFREAVALRGLPVPVLLARSGGSPADVLLALAPEMDALAVGSRGLSALAATVLGSTAQRLAGRSQRPVLVVRRQGGTRGLFGALFRA